MVSRACWFKIEYKFWNVTRLNKMYKFTHYIHAIQFTSRSSNTLKIYPMLHLNVLDSIMIEARHSMSTIACNRAHTRYLLAWLQLSSPLLQLARVHLLLLLQLQSLMLHQHLSCETNNTSPRYQQNSTVSYEVVEM